MGLIDTKLQTYYYNASNCLTKSAVLETNIKQSGGTRVLRIEYIFGMLLILPTGLSGALLVFLAEHIACKIYKMKDSSAESKDQVGRNRHDRAINKGATERGNGKDDGTAIEIVEEWAEVSHILCVIFLISCKLFWVKKFINVNILYRYFKKTMIKTLLMKFIMLYSCY